MLRRIVGVIFKFLKSKVYGFLRRFSVYFRIFFCYKLVLGIEISCDDIGAVVVDEIGNVLGEVLYF